MLRPETAADAAFRSEVRDWLAVQVPDALRHKTFRPLPAEGFLALLQQDDAAASAS